MPDKVAPNKVHQGQADLSAAGKNAGTLQPPAQFSKRETDPGITFASAENVPVFTVQRAKEVKAAPEATAIPDMTQSQINTFSTSRSPQDVLDNMRTMSVLNSIKGIPPLDQIGIYYSTDKSIYGEAFYDNSKTPKYWVNVYKAAFDLGLAEVYSTLRHELIHVAQYYKQVKNVATEALDTDVVFADSLVGEDNLKPGAEAAAEIETYAWEISNAASTGVSKAYIYSRGIGLEQHWPKLKAPTSGSALYKSTINAWRAKVSPLRTAAKTAFEAALAPVKWPDYRSAETYAAELLRIAPAPAAEMEL